MRLVFFADLHLDAPFAWLGGSQLAARRRRQALRDALRAIAHLALDVGADALLCGGDLYEHDRVTPDTAALLEQTFADLEPLRVFLAPGNHDWYGDDSLYRRATWSPNVHVFTEDRLTAVPLEDGLTLWGAAHRAPARTLGFLEDFTVGRGGLHLALFHGSERDGFPADAPGLQPHAPFSADQIARAGIHHALIGHYHRPRDAERYTYPGNPEFLTFGEDGERGAVIITVGADGRIAKERRRVGTTVAHDVSLDVTGATAVFEVRDRLGAMLAGREGVAQVTVSGALDPRIDLRAGDLQDIPHELDGLLVRVGDVRPALDIEAIASEPTVRGQFVRDVLDAELDERERHRVLTIGLRAFEGRTDLEPL